MVKEHEMAGMPHPPTLQPHPKLSPPQLSSLTPNSPASPPNVTLQIFSLAPTPSPTLQPHPTTVTPQPSSLIPNCHPPNLQPHPQPHLQFSSLTSHSPGTVTTAWDSEPDDHTDTFHLISHLLHQ
ncbi:extensin-like [Haliotis rubra]|uniref:extensin-like n=1 Tax=Haliotis rubra TaxID=36100 RepID=UPI001EE57822|nr:extensin-like [Haliotis rubra]